MVTPTAPQPLSVTPEREIDRLYLTCILGGTRYLLQTRLVREVEEVGAITPVPMTPIWLRGVMNLRGTIVPVVDLALFLGLATAPMNGGEAIVCTTGDAASDGDDDQLIALAVEGVTDIHSFGSSEIVPLPDGRQAGASARHWAGYYRTAARDEVAPELLGVLDLRSILDALSIDGQGAVGLGG
jgi:purine-binding chemotaxis protein CheW